MKAPVHSTVLAGGPIILYLQTQDATCGYASGSIIVQAANGTAPYTFIMDGYTQNTGNFPVEGAGVHTLTVTDATGASTTTTVTLTNILPGPILVPFTMAAPTNCSMTDGSVTLQPTGGTPPYTYSMDLINFQTSPVFSGLPSGDFFFYVKDANGCIGWNSIPMDARNCDANGGIIGEYTCHNDANLTAEDLSVNGNGPFQYSLDGSPWQSTGDFTGLGPGMHILRIQDNFGVIKIYGVSEAENCALTIQYVAVSAACMQNNGSLTVTAANGTAPYTYSIDGINYQASNVFNNLAPGNYYITAMDATGVKSSVPANVYDRCPVVEAVASPASCLGNDGVINAAGFKGTAPYQYSIDGVNFVASGVFSGLAPGNYTITIRDALGFTSTVSVIVPNGCLSVNATMTFSTCGNANGSIMASATNGTAPYMYSIDGVNFQLSGTFSGIAAGSYTVTVRDANGITATTTLTLFTIPGPSATGIPIPASCLNNDGAVYASGSVGTPPYQYALNGGAFQSGGGFTGLDSGMKIITVQDANGCTDTAMVDIHVASNLTVNAGAALTTCQGVGVALNGATNGTSYGWVLGSGASAGNGLQPTVTPDSTAEYYLNAVLGVCSAEDSVMVLVHPAPVPNAGADTAVCPGGNVELQGTGGVSYQWTPATFLSNPQIADPTVTDPLQSITYSLTVTDAMGCVSLQPSTVTVSLTPPPKVFAGDDTAVLIGQPLPLDAIDVGNSGVVSWQWTPAAGLSNPTVPDPVATITADITYFVTATSADGCVGTDSISVKVYLVSDIVAPNAFTPNGDGRNDRFKAVALGIRDFQYLAVYNRWGQRVFYSTDAGQGWDGTLGGQPQVTGVYVWMAAGVDYHGNTIQRKGTVILIR